MSNAAEIAVYFMDDVKDDERWESGRASVECEGRDKPNVNNSMLLESDKLVYQGSTEPARSNVTEATKLVSNEFLLSSELVPPSASR